MHGKAITDIDAIGERGDRLLLVSCKGIPFSDAWNRGECRAVLNVAAAADAAVADWRDRMAKLQAEPRGDNYDFSRHSELIGVVVFPLPPWSPTPDTCAEIAPGLRAASSADELGQWVQARYEVSARKLGGG